MAFRIASQTPMFQKGARAKPRVTPSAAGQRKPRERDKDHLGNIAMLPCLICGVQGVHVAHVRFACAAEDAPLVGKSEKPSDWRTLPLCPAHHVYGPEAQHSMNEEAFYTQHGINPYPLCRALYGVSGDIPLMNQLVAQAAKLFPARSA